MSNLCLLVFFTLEEELIHVKVGLLEGREREIERQMGPSTARWGD